MRRAVVAVLLLLFLTAQTGGVQVAEWIGMAWDARQAGIAAMLQAPLDPPCTMCRFANSLDDETDDATAALKKADAPIAHHAPVLPLGGTTPVAWPRPAPWNARSTTLTPDLPPPKA